MNYQRIYEYRFQGVDLNKKNEVWKEICELISRLTKSPKIVLDPAGGMCEFINNFQAEEKWAIDLNQEFIGKYANDSVKQVIGDILTIDLPEKYFELGFISNFLEHLHSQNEVAEFLEKMFVSVKEDGYIVVMGPNFKYAYGEYFDFADHTVCLTELGVAEHLAGAGFEIVKIYPKFLPLSFRGKLPVNKFLVQMYLKMPFFWNFFGKQFLVIGKK